MALNIIIDNRKLSVPEGMTILEAAKCAGIVIPTLCWLESINEISACRVCVVEVKGMPTLKPACSTKVTEGMEIITDSETVRNARRRNLELICSDHNMSCTECPKGADCRLRDLCREYEVDDAAFGTGKRMPIKDESMPHLVRDNEKCILCRRCESTCRVLQTVNAVFVNNRAFETNIGFGLPLNETSCVSCGQCIAACPTGALSVKDETKAFWKALYDKNTEVAVSLSSRAAQAVGRLFGDSPETDSTGKAVAALHRIGVKTVIDPDSYATEFGGIIRSVLEENIEKVSGPLIQCTCHAAKQFIERFYPQYTGNILPLSNRRNSMAVRCRELINETGRKICFVSIDGCTSAKTEHALYGPEHTPDVVLTARELFALVQRACVSGFTACQVWESLTPEPYDSLPFEGEPRHSGEKPLWKETFARIGNHEMKALEASGLSNVRRALDQITDYDLLRLHACPGGCVNGGGMPQKQ